MPGPFDNLIIYEKVGSRKTTLAADSTQNKVELTFCVGGTDNDLVCRAFVELNVPYFYLGLWLQTYDLEYQEGLLWHVRCDYGVDAPKMPEGEKNPGGNQPDRNGNVPTMKFDTTGGKLTVNRSLGTFGRFVEPGAPAAVQYFGIINWDGDKAGTTETVFQQFSFEETHYFHQDFITGAYKVLLFDYTAKVNNATFRGFKKGECLFLGASGSKRGTENWEIVYKFECRPNLTNVVIDNVTVPSIEGWSYRWETYRMETIGNRKIPRCDQVNVEQLYEYRDLRNLGIGAF